MAELADLAPYFLLAVLFAAIWYEAARGAARGCPYCRGMLSWPELFREWFRRK